MEPETKSITQLFREEMNKNAVLSESYKDHLTNLIMEAQRDGFVRGVEAGKKQERERAKRKKQ